MHPGHLNVLSHAGMPCLVIPKRCLTVLSDEGSHDLSAVWVKSASLSHAYPETSDTHCIRLKKKKKLLLVGYDLG